MANGVIYVPVEANSVAQNAIMPISSGEQGGSSFSVNLYWSFQANSGHDGGFTNYGWFENDEDGLVALWEKYPLEGYPGDYKGFLSYLNDKDFNVEHEIVQLQQQWDINKQFQFVNTHWEVLMSQGCIELVQ